MVDSWAQLRSRVQRRYEPSLPLRTTPVSPHTSLGPQFPLRIFLQASHTRPCCRPTAPPALGPSPAEGIQGQKALVGSGKGAQRRS